MGHAAEVKELARESAPIFVDRRVHREAQRALALLRQAAEEERATAELLRRLIAPGHRRSHPSRRRPPPPLPLRAFRPHLGRRALWRRDR